MLRYSFILLSLTSLIVLDSQAGDKAAEVLKEAGAAVALMALKSSSGPSPSRKPGKLKKRKRERDITDQENKDNKNSLPLYKDPFRCTLCPMTLAIKKVSHALNLHSGRISVDIDNFVCCSACPEMFKTFVLFNKHQADTGHRGHSFSLQAVDAAHKFICANE